MQCIRYSIFQKRCNVHTLGNYRTSVENIRTRKSTCTLTSARCINNGKCRKSVFSYLLTSAVDRSTATRLLRFVNAHALHDAACSQITLSSLVVAGVINNCSGVWRRDGGAVGLLRWSYIPLFAHWHDSNTTRQNFDNCFCMVPMAIARSSFGSVAIHYALPVLWMTSLFHVVSSVSRHVYSRAAREHSEPNGLKSNQILPNVKDKQYSR